MTAEFEIFKKDLIKINIYKEVVLDGTVSLKLFLDGSQNASDYMTNIHDDDVVMNRYGCFNISEDKNGGFITVRPALAKMGLKLVLNQKVPFSEPKQLTIFRNGVNEPEQSYDITYCESIDFIVDSDKYIVKINTSTNSVETQNAPINAPKTVEQPTGDNINSTQSDNKIESNTKAKQQDSNQKTEAIKAEAEKDYEQYAEKLEVIKENCEVDKALLEYYKDKDLVPIEKIFSELDEKIKAAEEQIKLFIEARQNKTKEIQE